MYKSTHHPLRVLIVEDAPATLTAVTPHLNTAGYLVDFASTIHQAEQLIRKNLYQFAIIDLILPGGGGTGFIYNLREKYPSLPILAVCDGKLIDPAPLLSGALLAGATAAHPKPLNLKKIVSEIRRLGKSPAHSSSKNMTSAAETQQT